MGFLRLDPLLAAIAFGLLTVLIPVVAYFLIKWTWNYLAWWFVHREEQHHPPAPANHWNEAYDEQQHQYPVRRRPNVDGEY